MIPVDVWNRESMAVVLRARGTTAGGIGIGAIFGEDAGSLTTEVMGDVGEVTVGAWVADCEYRAACARQTPTKDDRPPVVGDVLEVVDRYSPWLGAWAVFEQPVTDGDGMWRLQLRRQAQVRVRAPGSRRDA